MRYLLCIAKMKYRIYSGVEIRGRKCSVIFQKSRQGTNNNFMWVFSHVVWLNKQPMLFSRDFKNIGVAVEVLKSH